MPVLPLLNFCNLRTFWIFSVYNLLLSQVDESVEVYTSVEGNWITE
jgi:hypothetical protein